MDDEFGQREIGTLYNLAMMTRVDELNDEKHMNMTYVEFLEGIGRIADRLKLPPVIEEGSEQLREFDKVLKSIEVRRKSMVLPTPLSKKIETFIYMMSMSCLSREHNIVLRKQILKLHMTKKEAIILSSDEYTSSD